MSNEDQFADTGISTEMPDDVPAEAAPELDVPADPYEIPTLLLPSGGHVEFKRIDGLTAANIRYLRKARDAEGQGSFYNDLCERGMRLLIATWDIPGRALKTPQADPSASDKLQAFDLTAIERHMQPYLLRALGDADEASKSGESRPESD